MEVRGIINEDFLDLTEATTHNLEAVAQTPSSGLLSTRDKPDEAYCRRICEAKLPVLLSLDGMGPEIYERLRKLEGWQSGMVVRCDKCGS